VLAALALLERRRHGPASRAVAGYAAAAGAFFAADLILWHHAIADVGAGLATVLANLQVVLVAVAAWLLLGERPSARVAAAVPLVFAGAVLISGVVGDEAFGSDPALGRSTAC
jgi:drug/metabolite transporter (DMT)-like permease